MVSSQWSYRPALDGLRALAVYAVVFYHSGITKASGGFVGVDLFFVLSGFLVTNVILSECDSGTFHPFRFWARRFRRLLPAIFVTITLTAIAFAAITMPAEREMALSEARSAALYFANWHFLSAGNDYFASEDLARPFTHFWSLSVEEQFYFGFPLIVLASSWIASKLRRGIDKSLGWIVAALAVASVISQIWSAHGSELRAYYATDARIYQILMGSLCAILLRNSSLRARTSSTSHAVSTMTTALGMFLFVIVASDYLDITASVRGFVAVAASLLIITSLETAPGTVFGKLLSRPSVVHLGRLSYGTYLWHWPVIVLLGRIVTVRPAITALATIIISTAFAEFSLRAVETPIRTSALLHRLSKTSITLGLSASALLGFVLVPGILLNNGHSVLISTANGLGTSSTDTSIDYALPSVVDWKAAKLDIPTLPDCVSTTPRDCVVVPGTSQSLRVHLIGDSHARTLIPALTEIAKEKGWTFSVTAIGGCPWQLNLRYANDVERTKRCDIHQKAWFDRIIPDLNPDVVVLFNRAFDDPKFQRKMYIKGEEGSGDSQFEIVRTTSDTTVNSLIADGRKVIAVEPVPLTRSDVTNCLSGATTQQQCTFSASPGPLPTEVALRHLDLRNSNMASINIDALACPQLPLCLPIVDGIIVRRDAHHFTGTYSAHIAPALASQMEGTGLLLHH